MRNLRSSLVCLLLSFVACLAPLSASAASPDEDRAEKVATRFLKDYLGGGYLDYFRESTLVTTAAKAALRKLEAAAKKRNPELGLDHDPVVQGQDHAETYRIENIVIDGDKATGEGVAEGFPKIPLRLVRAKGGWLIDGAGEINPAPKAKS
jgi:hypothetical protein